MMHDHFRTFLVAGCLLGLTGLALIPAADATLPGREAHDANPILPGYYADPSIVQVDGKTFIYATLDPWGDRTLGCWESGDFKHWTYRVLNWPTKSACSSPTSGGAAVWAPSVLHGADGRYHMFISVGNEVWAGVADSPTGPWRNAVSENKPLIAKNFRPGFHMIDAEGFIDDDGTPYLYWGSGYGWKNGKCWAVKLKPDMVTFDGEVQDVTPNRYFEGPFMAKRHGLYFLMYSSGKTVEDTYRVHYAVSKTPFGPFTEGANSPILVTDKANNVISPGHHAVFKREGKDYILYHRQSIPFERGFIGRQTCVDELVFTPDGRIETVKPTHVGPVLVQGRASQANLAMTATASTSASSLTGPECALDDNYATRWTPAKDATGVWLQLDLGAVKAIGHQELVPEYAWKNYRFTVSASTDGTTWTEVENHLNQPISGSPLVIDRPLSARYLRLTLPDVTPQTAKEPRLALWEWTVNAAR
jgi:beta-xylosidase